MTPVLENNRVAAGAGAALLGRLGALIEALSFIAFAWFYGAETYGLFAVLWAYVKVMTAITDGGMTTTLQRFIAAADTEKANKIVGFAVKFSLMMAIAGSVLITVFAPDLVNFINAASKDQDKLVTILRIYIWVLPFWTLVEVSTASIRAKRTFGPEIKVRIFYEQGLRLICGIGMAIFGYLSYGLFFAHLISVIAAALLGLRLIAKHYDLKQVIMAPFWHADNRELLTFGYHIMPANLSKMLFSELPVIFLNQLLPGAAGAAASAYYAIARKIASVLQVIRKTFEYVMAPLAAEKTAHDDVESLSHMTQFATRMSITLAIPVCVFLIVGHFDLLKSMPADFITASSAIIILSLSRLAESATGPSAAVIEMIGHRSLPIINNVIGMTILCSLAYYTVPTWGVTGAAVAAAIGINVTAWLSFIQGMLFYNLHPYNRQMIFPVLMSLGCQLPLITFVLSPYAQVPAPSLIIIGLVNLILSCWALIRYGICDDDCQSLGPLGRLCKGKPS